MIVKWNFRENVQDRNNIVLYLSVSTRVVIGQFSWPYFTVRPAKIESCSFPARPINLRDKYLTNLVSSVRTVSYGSSFFLVNLSINGKKLGP